MNSSIARVLPPLLFSLTSCASIRDLINGPAQDPAAETTPATVESDSSAAPPKPGPPSLPLDTTFTYGQWHLHRTSRALFGWTGTGEQFRLVAVELDTEVTCWYSQHAGRPEAQHCLDGDAPLASVKLVRNGKEVENIFSSGFDKIPWKTPNPETPLPDGTWTLPDASGHGVGTLEHTADTVTVRTDWSRWQRAFTLPSGSNAYLVDGNSPDAFDGCASADGTISVIEGIRVQVGKKCDMLRGRENTTVTLSVGQSELSFSRSDDAPDLSRERARAAQARKAIVPPARLQLDVTGDATRTLVALAAKKPDGDGMSRVEAIATIRGVHYRCEGSVERFDPAWVESMKQICGSMANSR